MTAKLVKLTKTSSSKGRKKELLGWYFFMARGFSGVRIPYTSIRNIWTFFLLCDKMSTFHKILFSNIPPQNSLQFQLNSVSRKTEGKKSKFPQKPIAECFKSQKFVCWRWKNIYLWCLRQKLLFIYFMVFIRLNDVYRDIFLFECNFCFLILRFLGGKIYCGILLWWCCWYEGYLLFFFENFKKNWGFLKALDLIRRKQGTST